MENDRFANSDEAAKFLVQVRPEYLGGLGGLYNMFYTAVLKTADTIRSGKPQAKFDFRNLPDEELLAYYKKQVHSSKKGGEEIAAKYDFSAFKNLLDAGGGSGGVSIGLCAKYPQLKATVADFPKVAKLAKGFIAEAGMTERIDTSPVDLCAEPPAGQYDVAVLRALIQTISMEEARACLKHIAHSLVPDGQFFIFGSILENSRLAPAISVTNDLGFINFYDHGRSYTEGEYGEMLTQAGFTDITVEYGALLDGMGLMRARKP